MWFSRKIDLEERLRKLETAQKELALEWQLAYEKLVSLMGRVAKRAEKAAQLEKPDQTSEEAVPDHQPGAGASERTPTGRFLTARQLTIQQQILRRRIGGH